MLRRAEVVFTGGASLYEAKVDFNPNTHLFASGVDAEHYAKACLRETSVPAWMESIPAPRATYIGVIDERMDYDIIEAMTRRRPDIQFVLVGPVVKVDPASLPQAPNLHYAGQQKYEDLPGILKGTDVCLMPFAMNDATKFISPTKTLEYMATHRPIVSTPIRDVERFYSDIVFLAGDSDEFILQIEAALNESAFERGKRGIREQQILADHDWDAIAEKMDLLMESAHSERTRLPLPARPVRAGASSITVRPSAATSTIVTPTPSLNAKDAVANQ